MAKTGQTLPRTVGVCLYKLGLWNTWPINIFQTEERNERHFKRAIQGGGVCAGSKAKMCAKYAQIRAKICIKYAQICVKYVLICATLKMGSGWPPLSHRQCNFAQPYQLLAFFQQLSARRKTCHSSTFLLECYGRPQHRKAGEPMTQRGWSAKISLCCAWDKAREGQRQGNG